MKYLISFADSRYLKTLERVRSQAADMAVYDNIITYTEEDLDSDFKLKIGDWLRAKKPEVTDFGLGNLRLSYKH